MTDQSLNFLVARPQSVEINLRELPFADWPDEAKQLAHLILEKPGATVELAEQLDKRDWLAARVTAKQYAMLALERWLTQL